MTQSSRNVSILENRMCTECQSCDESDKSLEKFVTWKHVELYIEYFPRFFYKKKIIITFICGEMVTALKWL